MTAWIWPISADNYAVLDAQGYKYMDLRRQPHHVQPGHKVAVYVVGKIGIAAILEVSSQVHKRQAQAPIWADELQAGKALYPYRVDTRLVTKGWADFRRLWPKLQSPSAKVRAMGPGGLGIFLRGVALREIDDSDMSLIGAALSGATPVPPPLPAPPSPPPPATPPSSRRTKKRVFGPPLNFRELRHEPINEQGVVYLFGMVARELGFLVEGVAAEFPDCMAKRRTKAGYYEPVSIEFEFKAGNFHQHGHEPKACDIIVCWENDWPGCPLEVIELKEEIKRL